MSRSPSSTTPGVRGSADLDRRSWSPDSELSVAVLDETRDEREPTDPGGHGDGTRTFVRNLRLELLREHLDRTQGKTRTSWAPTPPCAP